MIYKKKREYSVNESISDEKRRMRKFFLFRFLHQQNKGTRRDEKSAENDFRIGGFVENQDRKENCNRDTEFVDRRDFGGVSELKRTEIEQPGKPRRGAGEKKEKPVVRSYLPDLVRHAGEKDDSPCDEKNDRHPDCRGEI